MKLYLEERDGERKITQKKQRRSMKASMVRTNIYRSTLIRFGLRFKVFGFLV